MAVAIEGTAPKTMMDDGAYTTDRQRDVTRLSEGLMDEVRRLTATLSPHELVQFARELLYGTPTAVNEELMLEYSAQLFSDLAEDNDDRAARTGAFLAARRVLNNAQHKKNGSAYRALAQQVEAAVCMGEQEAQAVQWARNLLEYASQEGIAIDTAKNNMEELDGDVFVLHGSRPSLVMEFIRAHYAEVAVTHDSDAQHALLKGALEDRNRVRLLSCLQLLEAHLLGLLLRDVIDVMLDRVRAEDGDDLMEALRLVLSNTLINDRIPQRIKESLRREISRYR